MPKPAFDYVTFDCYGTLIDWESGIVDAFTRAAAFDGVTVSRDAVLAAYAAVEPVVEREHYRSYRDVLAESAARVAHGLGWPLAWERAGFLAESLPSWKPFADTNPALQRLRDAGCKLGVLSNIDDDLLRATRRHFTVDFDLVITAEQVKSYKPAPGHFLRAKEKIGSARWLHAAQSNFHDIVPANAMGIPSAWINRRGQKALAGGEPTYAFRNLEEFAAAMT